MMDTKNHGVPSPQDGLLCWSLDGFCHWAEPHYQISFNLSICSNFLGNLLLMSLFDVSAKMGKREKNSALSVAAGTNIFFVYTASAVCPWQVVQRPRFS